MFGEGNIWECCGLTQLKPPRLDARVETNIRWTIWLTCKFDSVSELTRTSSRADQSRIKEGVALGALHMDPDPPYIVRPFGPFGIFTTP